MYQQHVNDLLPSNKNDFQAELHGIQTSNIKKLAFKKVFANNEKSVLKKNHRDTKIVSILKKVKENTSPLVEPHPLSPNSSTAHGLTPKDNNVNLHRSYITPLRSEKVSLALNHAESYEDVKKKNDEYTGILRISYET